MNQGNQFFHACQDAFKVDADGAVEDENGVQCPAWITPEVVTHMKSAIDTLCESSQLTLSYICDFLYLVSG